MGTSVTTSTKLNYARLPLNGLILSTVVEGGHGNPLQDALSGDPENGGTRVTCQTRCVDWVPGRELGRRAAEPHDDPAMVIWRVTVAAASQT